MKPDFPIVGVGASAGGLESLQRFFDAVPATCGLAFVVVQHLSPRFKSMMDKLLRRCTDIPVQVVEDGVEVRPDNIYLIPPAKQLILVDNHLALADTDPNELIHLPIDRFLESLGRSRGKRSAAVILSGTGSDGTRGVRVVSECGGVVLAESRATAAFGGMPKSAQDTGVVDAVLAPEEMATFLLRRLGDPGDDSDDGEDTVPLERLLKALRERYDTDFGLYKRSTLRRRLARRASLAEQPLEAYVAHSVLDAAELHAIYEDVLIGVTRFFRDRECFDRIGELLEGRIADLDVSDELRIWSAGCASGQEAYSLAIIACEAAERLGREPQVKVFATDIHAGSIEHAMGGVYRSNELEDVSQQQLERYFERVDRDRFRVVASLRRRVVFAQHDILHDAPFTNMDLVTCRNLLIYLRSEGQQRAISYIRFALAPGGLVMLGPSEATSLLDGDFSPIDERLRIYRARSRDTRATMPAHFRTPIRPRPVVQPQRSATLDAYDALCDRYMPPSFLLDEDRKLIDCFAGAERYVTIGARRISTEFVSLLRTDNQGAVFSALRTAEREAGIVRIPELTLETESGAETVELKVERLDVAHGRTHFLVAIGAATPRPDARVDLDASQPKGDTSDLERELQDTRLQLQHTVQELEAANEELQATNEELIASNEELQATNEELSSVNEELYTVNTEYQSTIGKLHDANAAMEQLFEATEVATLFVDQSICILRLTPTSTAIVDATEQDIGRPLGSFKSKVQWDSMIADIQRVLDTGEPLALEAVSHDEQRTWFVRGHRYEAFDRSRGAVVTFTDISSLARARADLQRSEKRLAETTNALPVLISYFNRDGQYEFMNATYEKLFERPREELLGHTPAELVGTDKFSEVEHYVWAALAGERQEYVVAVDLPSDDEPRYFQATLTPDYEGDEVVGVHSVATDITARRRIEIELEQARTAATEADRAKSEFLANMSHEIRTPMTAILGYADLIASEKHTSPAVRQHLETIRRNGRHLMGVIDDVLDLSRIEHGAELEAAVHVAPSEIVAEVFEMFRLRAEKKGIRLDLTLPPLLPVEVRTQPQRVRQILINLVSNAIKFTQEGSVHVSVEVELEDDQPAELRFRVADTGIGFPSDRAHELFEPFHQIDGSHTRTFKGAGLGLAISHRLATLLGGSLTASSALGSGSTFTFVLPLSNGPYEMAPPSTREVVHDPQHEPITPLTGSLLVVDDSRDIRRLLADIVKRAGAEVTTAKSGRAALDLIAKGNTYDVMLIDVQMPEMDGLEVTRRLRADGYENAIVAVTARALKADREQCLEAGCNDYLSKPVKASELTRRVGALIELGYGRPAKTSVLEPDEKVARRVMIVEDDEDAGELLVMLLQQRGYDAHWVSSLADAQSRWSEHGADVILCDLGLQDGDGRALAQHIRGAGDKKTRLIAVSGRQGGAPQATEAGFDAFLQKPVTAEQLTAAVEDDA
ncbi:MAG: chemotaxis protein CheB [Deltaproteobacteria bacterium]